ncbi:hypothetical protein T492DRAFT_873160, partial [Pavlovales sp. CCMP2436]
ALPRVLTVHLLRYSYDIKSFTRKKCTDAVQFAQLHASKSAPDTLPGAEGGSAASGVQGGVSDSRYELVGVLSHVGSAAGPTDSLL